MPLNKLSDIVWPDTSGLNKLKIPEESHYGYPTGWICPKCGRVYGPFINECPYCNKPDYTITCMW